MGIQAWFKRHFMKTWVIVTGIVILAAAGLFLSFPKNVGNHNEARVIQLITKTSTWRPGEKPYDIEGSVRRSLENVGFKVISEDNENVQAALHVNYVESRKVSGSSHREEGTTIDGEMELVHKELGFIFRDHINSETVDQFERKLERLNLGQKVILFMAMSTNPEKRLEYAYTLSQTKDGSYRADSARVLVKIEDPQAAKILIELLNDEDHRVRAQAATSLGDRKSLMGVQPLIDILNREMDFAVSHKAIESLGKIGDKRAIEPIRRFTQRDTRVETQQIARQAIERIEIANP